jgi:hypothetical protein
LDIWGGTLPDPPIGPTVDDLLAALDAQENTDMSRPRDVVVGGFSGQRVRMRIAQSDCPEADSLVMWVDPRGEPGRGLAPGEPDDTLWIVDVDGQRVVIVTSLDPSLADEGDVSELIDTIEFVVN